jgi:hypothetical protein
VTRYNRATRPTDSERTASGVLSDREIDRRIRRLVAKRKAEAMAATQRRRRAAP